MSEPDIMINQADIGGEMQKQPAHFFYIAEQAVQAEAMFETGKFKLDQTVATLDSQIREKAANEGKKLTEKLIEKEVELHPSYKDAKVHLIKAKANKEMWKAKREAWYQRKDMLVQMAINQRSELESIQSSKVKAKAA